MPIVLVLTWVALTNVAAWPRPRKPKPLADPDEQWRSAADES